MQSGKDYPDENGRFIGSNTEIIDENGNVNNSEFSNLVYKGKENGHIAA